MSYDFYLEKDGKVCEVPSHEEGGNYTVGGTTEASLNITYNYSCFYYWFLDEHEGLKWLLDKKAKDTIERLEKAIKILGVRQNKDYWADTPGNAGHALEILLLWAKIHPEAVWKGGV